ADTYLLLDATVVTIEDDKLLGIPVHRGDLGNSIPVEITDRHPANVVSRFVGRSEVEGHGKLRELRRYSFAEHVVTHIESLTRLTIRAVAVVTVNEAVEVVLNPVSRELRLCPGRASVQPGGDRQKQKQLFHTRSNS